MKKIIYTLIALGTLLASCSKEVELEQLTTSNFPEDGIIRVSPQISQSTRAGLTIENLNEFWLHINSQDDNYDYYAYIKKEGEVWNSYDASDKSTPLVMRWMSSTESIEVTAATYDFNGSSLTYELPTDQSTTQGIQSADLLWFNKVIDPTSADINIYGAIEINFAHILSRLQIRLNIPSAYRNIPISEVSITGVSDKLTFDSAFSSQYTVSTEAQDSPIVAHLTSTNTKDGIAEFEAILIPSSYNKLYVSIEYPTQYNMSDKWTSTKEVTLERAKSHDLEIDVDISFTQIISDAEFRKELFEKYPLWEEDGVIDFMEINEVTDLLIDDADISTLDGIHFFENLKTITIKKSIIEDVTLSTLINVDSFAKLNSISIDESEIENLNLTNLPNLTSLDWSGNNISYLDIMNIPRLSWLELNSNGLKSLRLTNLDNLRYLDCSENSLTELTLSNLPNLINLLCQNNELTSLNLSSVENLNRLLCGVNKISTLNLSNLDDLVDLRCSRNSLSTLDLSNNTKIEVLECYLNHLQSLDVTKLTELCKIPGTDNYESLYLSCGLQTYKEGGIIYMKLYITQSQHNNKIFSFDQASNKNINVIVSNT